MSDRTWRKDVERAFDGEGTPVSGAEAEAYTRDLQRMRDGVEAVREQPEISDAQFGSFMAGIREQIDTPTRGHHRGLWAVASLCAASLLVALSVYLVVFTGTNGVHSEVEAATTEIPGAAVDWESDDEGNAEVWVLDVGGKDVM